MTRIKYSHNTTQTIIMLFFVVVVFIVLYTSRRLSDNSSVEKRTYAQEAYEYINQRVTNEDLLPKPTP